MEYPDEDLNDWFKNLTPSKIKGSLHGWFLWQRFMVDKNISVQKMVESRNPALLVSSFIRFMAVQEVPQYQRHEAMPAIHLIFDVIRPEVNLSTNTFLQSVLKEYSAITKPHSKYTTIWKLEIMIDFVVNDIPSEELDFMDLQIRLAWLLMVFVPLRPAAMLRLDTTMQKKSAGDESFEVCGHDKTDVGKGVSWFVFRKLKERNLCPQVNYNLVKKRAHERGFVGKGLFFTKTGKQMATSDVLCKGMTALLRKAGIMEPYTAYSTRHAVISALFRSGLQEKEVNAYTGHSHNSHTALNFYYHLDAAWVGSKLAALKTDAGISKKWLWKKWLK
jgi:integrase